MTWVRTGRIALLSVVFVGKVSAELPLHILLREIKKAGSSTLALLYNLYLPHRSTVRTISRRTLRNHTELQEDIFLFCAKGRWRISSLKLVLFITLLIERSTDLSLRQCSLFPYYFWLMIVSPLIARLALLYCVWIYLKISLPTHCEVIIFIIQYSLQIGTCEQLKISPFQLLYSVCSFLLDVDKNVSATRVYGSLQVHLPELFSISFFLYPKISISTTFHPISTNDLNCNIDMIERLVVASCS